MKKYLIFILAIITAAVSARGELPADTVAPRQSFSTDVRANMLYDAVLVPNIGAEFRLEKDMSIPDDDTSARWFIYRRYRFWRIYTLNLSADTVAPRRNFYMDIRTNLLYDAALVPNIGVEFWLGKRMSVLGDWAYAWWNSNRRHHYWRIYGGELELRYWLGERAAQKPLQGHHLGLYGQWVTYDFEFGHTGQMGGEPGDNIFRRANYGIGLAYGYSLPVARRLNIDFTIGMGYFWGKYYEYIPNGGVYVWQRTCHRHFFGPTKIEVSLQWLIGRGNVNPKAGKERPQP